MSATHAIGRRKTAVARVYLNEIKGKEAAGISVNGRDYKEYFNTQALHYKVEQPLRLVDLLDKYQIKVNLEGGGITGQAEALRLALSRALCEINPEFRPVLKPDGLLTRDPRMVERKKFGQKKARKRFQFSKR